MLPSSLEMSHHPLTCLSQQQIFQLRTPHFAIMTSQTMPSSLATFDDLEIGFSTCEIHARVLHFWEARNPNKGNSLMGLEVLLLDAKSTLLQVFIPANRIPLFESELKTHAVYSIKNFHVAESTKTYRVAGHKSMIHFTTETVLAEIKDEEKCIEMEKFRFHSYEDFDSNADTNEDLCDALGKIVLIDNNQSYLDNTKGRLGIHLHLKDGPVVRVTLWTAVAMKFREVFAKMSLEPTVLLATAINPRRIGGLLYLNSTSATRFFFDKDVQPTSDYLTWLSENNPAGGKIAYPTSEVTKLELITLAELNAFLSTKSPQRAGFTCEATITDIVADYGWNYIACTKCTCKLKRTATKLACGKCNDENAVGILRYRVELLVKDKDKTSATFVIFDRDVTQLTGKKAADVVENNKQIAKTSSDLSDGDIPQCLLDAVGKTFTFQIKVTEYNFNASRQTITVSRILNNIEAKVPKSPEMGEESVGIKDTSSERGEEMLAKSNGNVLNLVNTKVIGEK